MSSSPFPQPTTWDWGGNNENKTKMQTPDGNRYTGLSLVTKDAYPSVSTFNSLRSPLDPIPGNSGPVSGLRQRRGAQNFDVYDKSNSNAFMSNEKTNRPPRASLTMSMGSKVSSMAPTTPVVNERTSSTTSTDIALPAEEFWVLVFGFTNRRQYEDVTRKFKTEDYVVETKGGPPKNWVAIRYETDIAVEKAVCNSPCIVSGGCVCGVTRLQNSQSFFQKQQQQHAILSTPISNDRTEGLFDTKNMIGGRSGTDNANKDHKADEDDIYVPNKEMENIKNKNICEAFMGWLYGW